jgi:aryl-alcohol dehydrogenase-like predicted oxidoreductase
MAPNVEITELAPDLPITRILNGMWQVSGGHGSIDPRVAIEEMEAYLDAGLTTWDLADHYGPAEDFVGIFRKKLRAEKKAEKLANVKFFTKWVPRPNKMPRKLVEQAIDVSRRRMGMETLDLLQFHWWDYADPNYLDALRNLDALRAEGKLQHLALTNFDTTHWSTIIDQGIEAISNQVQYSVVDARPRQQMQALCEARGVHVLAYGTLCGGLLSESYLGAGEPNTATLNTASLRKYKNIIDAWGGWGLFQELLAVLGDVATRHEVSMSNVAVRWVLDQPAVAGVIIGARLSIAQHIEENLRIFDLKLEEEDYAAIEAVQEKSRDLMKVIGDCGDEYR